MAGFQITKKFALLCEGPADQAFFVKLFARRKINGFDIPAHGVMGKFYGVDGFGGMLRALSGDPSGYAGLKGVLMVADAGDDPERTLRRVCRSINRDGPFDAASRFIKPTAAFRVTSQPAGHPAVSVALIPDSGLGGLETICAESAFGTKPWLRRCVQTYLSCGKLNVSEWPSERQGKAAMQCIIAALHKKDPNKPLAQLLTRKQSIINFRSANFTPFVRYVRRFCREVAAL